MGLGKIIGAVGRGAAYAALAATVYCTPLGCAAQYNTKAIDPKPAKLTRMRDQLDNSRAESPLEEHVLGKKPEYSKKEEQEAPHDRSRKDPARFWRHMEEGAKNSNVSVKEFAYGYIVHLNKRMYRELGEMADCMKNRDWEGRIQNQRELHQVQDHLKWVMAQYKSRYLPGRD